MAKIMLVDDAAFMRMMIKKALTQSVQRFCGGSGWSGSREKVW